MNKERYGQLHSHTPASDGLNTIDDIVQSGVNFIAITDHDTTANVAPYAQALAPHGIEVIPGIELSIRHMEQDMHMLCYWPEFLDGAQEMLDDYCRARNNRGAAMMEKLRGQGWSVTDEMLAVVRSKNGALSKGEVAALMLDNPANHEKLSAEGILTGSLTESVDKFIKAYLRKGHPAYIKLQGMPLEYVTTKIRGCFVLAHPGHDLDHNDPAHDAIIEDMARRYGVIGIESGSRKHDEHERKHYENIADRLHLVKTTSADAHVPAQLSRGLMQYGIIDQLRTAYKR